MLKLGIEFVDISGYNKPYYIFRGENMIKELLSNIGRAVVLSEWKEIQSDVDNGRTSPNLTIVFMVLLSVLVIGIVTYILVKKWLRIKHERERLEKGMGTGIPHIKALDNNLPGRSLSTLYKENNIEKRR